MTVYHCFSAWTAAVVLFFAAAPPVSKSSPATGNKVLLIAHRGASGAAPENTLTAIRRAFEVGSDAVEVDIRYTRDRQIVLMHDPTVDRTTNGSGPVGEFTLDEIRQLDAGAWKDPVYRGERVPTLRETLEVARAAGRTLYLDVKDSEMGSEIRKVLDSLGLPPRKIWVAINTEENAIDIYRHLAGARIIYWGKVPRPLPDAFFSGLRALGVTGFDFCWECDDRSQWERYSDAVLKKSKKHGFSFFVWTLNRPAYMKRAIAAGVDGIETDFPKRFVACCR